MSVFETAVIKTLSYFDLFEHPLTREELYRFLWEGDRQMDYAAFLIHLQELLSSSGKIESSGGYLFLCGSKQHIAAREQRVWYIEEKMRIAKKAARIFRFIPFFRAMFVCNQIEVGVSKESDIDVFIVVRQGRLWITRFLTTLLASLFGLRRAGKHVANHICLSFYATDDALDFSEIHVQHPDVYTAYWLETLIPVYDPEDVLQDILRENVWQRELLPHRRNDCALTKRWRVDNNRCSRAVRKVFELFWGTSYGVLIERQAKKLQLQKMKRNAGSKANEDTTDVIISDRMLKFHENDRRLLFRKQWMEKWQTLLK